jgi:hypothetical protein
MKERHELCINPAGSGWALLMQSGVLVDCRVNQSLDNLLRDDFNLSDSDIAGLEALILDGSSVDDTKIALVRPHSRLALAAGLPGVAGMALKKNSALQGLRNSITYKAEEMPAESQPGQICLALYSLVLARLGHRFLARGIWITAKQLLRYAAFNQKDLVQRGAETITIDKLIEEVSSDPMDLYFLKAQINPSDNQDKLSDKKSPKTDPSCRNCPIGCQKPQKTGWSRHEEELAQLWGLDPQTPGIKDLAGDFKRLSNDLGLEAFELSGSLALVLSGTQAPRTLESVRHLFQELYNDTALGHLMGMGRSATALAFGLDPSTLTGPQKKSPHSPAITAFLDSLGICEQAAGPLMNQEALSALGEILSARYGRLFVWKELQDMGQKVLSGEEEFGRKAALKEN